MTHIATGTGGLVSDPFGGRTFQYSLQSLSYGYYPDGKLQVRNDLDLNASESFTYDNVDRVKTWSVSSVQSSVQYGYDDSGNLTSRQQSSPGASTLESFGYGANGAGPHALTSGPLGLYGYDPGGRQTSRPGQPSLTYTAFDLPKVIQTAGDSSTFVYGAAGQRIRKTTSTSDIVTLEGLYERRLQNGAVSHVFYLPGGGKIVGQITCDAAGVCGAPLFYHRDRLGSVDTVTSNAGVFGRQKRDPFGRIYAAANFTDPNPTVSLGFVGQNEDRSEGLINLNHRLYDPNIGRFISPDPLVKGAYDGQAFNRFTYARNNPLSFIDPSGLQAASSDDADSEVDPGGPPTTFQIVDNEVPPEPGLEIAKQPELANGAAGMTIRMVADDGRVYIGHGWISGPAEIGLDPVDQIADAEVPGRGPNFADSPTSPPGVPDLGKVVVNAAVTFVMAPIIALGNVAGPDVPKLDINQVRPFPYSEQQRAIGTAMELSIQVIATAGLSLAAVADAAAIAAGEAGGIATGDGAAAGGEAGGASAGDAASVGDTAAGPASGSLGPPKVGDPVYRVFGGKAGPYGRSWTRVDPSTVPNYRNAAGLPDVNTGQYVIEGRLTDVTGVTYREALPFEDPASGGLDELLLVDPEAQMSIDSVLGVNPEF